MITTPIQTLFDDVNERQVEGIPYLTADRSPEHYTGRNNTEKAVSRLTEIMPAGETMRLGDIYQNSRLPEKLVQGVLTRSSQFKKVERGKWVRK